MWMHVTAWVWCSEGNSVESVFFFHLYVGSRDQTQITRHVWHLYLPVILPRPPLFAKSRSLTGTWDLLSRLGWLASDYQSICLYIPTVVIINIHYHVWLFMWVLGSSAIWQALTNWSIFLTLLKVFLWGNKLIKLND